MKYIINNGNIEPIVINPPAINISHANWAKIANNKCPAVILAANRTPKENALAVYDINSTITKNGAKYIGLPLGKKVEKNNDLYLTSDINKHPKNIDTLKPKVICIKAVGVKVYGIIPIKLINTMKTNSIFINGK